MNSLTFNQAWVKDGRMISRAKAAPERDISPSDDDYPAYHKFLKKDKIPVSDDPKRRRGLQAEDLVTSRRVYARAASKGTHAKMDTHAKAKFDLESFVQQRRHVVDSMISSSSPKGVSSGMKSASTSTTASTTSRTFARITTPLIVGGAPTASSWSSDDSINNDFSMEWCRRIGRGRSGRTEAPSGPSSHGTCCTPSSRCTTVSLHPRHHSHLSDPCLCDACIARNERLASAAIIAVAAGTRRGTVNCNVDRGLPEDAASQTSGSSLSSNCRQQLREIVIPDPQVLDPHVSSRCLAAALRGAGRRDGLLPPPPPPPPPPRPPPSPLIQLNFKVPQSRVASDDELPTPRMKWLSYLDREQGASGAQSKVVDGNVARDRPRSTSYGSSCAPLKRATSKLRQDIGSTSSGGGDSTRGGSPVASGPRDVRSAACGGGAARRLQHLKNLPLLAPHRDASVAGWLEGGADGSGSRVAQRPPQGLRYMGPKAYDSDSDSDTTQEEEETVEQLLGETARWLRQKQLQMRRKKELESLRISARRRARFAVMGPQADGGRGCDDESDCRSNGTRRSCGKSSRSSSSFERAAAVASQAYANVGASLAAWPSYPTIHGARRVNITQGHNTALGSSLGLSASEYLREMRRGYRSKSAGGTAAGKAAGGWSRPHSSRSKSPAWAPTALERRLHSTTGGAGGGNEFEGNENAARSQRARVWRDAALMLSRGLGRRCMYSPTGYGHAAGSAMSTGTRKGALSDRSEASLAQRLTAAAASRCLSAPRLGGRRCNSDWERRLQRQRLIAAGLASPSARSIASTQSPSSVGDGAGAYAASDVSSGTVAARAAGRLRPGGDGIKSRNWYLTDVLRTPVGSNVDEDGLLTHGSSHPRAGGALSAQWPGLSWAASPSQQLSLCHGSRVWGPIGQGNDGAFVGDELGGAGGLWSPLSAASDDVLWRSPPRPLSAPRLSTHQCYPALSADQASTMAAVVLGTDDSQALPGSAEGRRRTSKLAQPSATARSAAASVLAATSGRLKRPPLPPRSDPSHPSLAGTPFSHIQNAISHQLDGHTDKRTGKAMKEQ